MTRYFVGLGANLGDRLASLRSATIAIADTEGVELKARSSVWQTRPLGGGSKPYLNAAVELSSGLEPRALLSRLLEIERDHGRVRRERWGDRSLDLDLLCAFDEQGELERDEPGLILPHPGLPTRDFVLCPLLELDPDLRVGGRPCAERLADIDAADRTVLARLDAPL